MIKLFKNGLWKRAFEIEGSEAAKFQYIALPLRIKICQNQVLQNRICGLKSIFKQLLLLKNVGQGRLNAKQFAKIAFK